MLDTSMSVTCCDVFEFKGAFEFQMTFQVSRPFPKCQGAAEGGDDMKVTSCRYPLGSLKINC